MSARVVVRYGSMRHLGEFAARDLVEGGRPVELSRGDRVVVRSKRGTEYGEVLCEATSRTRELLSESEQTGRVLRRATDGDERVREDGWRKAETALEAAGREVKTRRLSMQLVDVESLLGGEKLTFYFTAEARVDFRELVKALAARFKTRIEMRQIGVRDEAKLLADYGDCGKPVCCNTHLKEMPPVSMKMAKLQKASLDPNKISGRCGRLKCCLRYEYDTYEEHRKELPKPGKWVVTAEGKGRVVAQEILAKKLLVAFEDGRRVMIDGSDVLTVVTGPKRPSRSPKKTASPDAKSTEAKATDAKAASSQAEVADSEGSDGEGTSAAGEEAKPAKKRRRKPRKRKPRDTPPPE